MYAVFSPDHSVLESNLEESIWRPGKYCLVCDGLSNYSLFWECHQDYLGILGGGHGFVPDASRRRFFTMLGSSVDLLACLLPMPREFGRFVNL